MSYIKRIIPLFLILSCSLTVQIYGQNQEKSFNDTTYKAYINNVWEEIKSIEDDQQKQKLQNKYAKKLYDYYRQHPKTETGHKALSEAFKMWADIGTDRYIDEVLETLDNDSSVWVKIIWPLYTIYHKSEKRNMNQFKELLVELKNELTDPVSKSEVLFTLIRREKADENFDAIIPLAEELIELDATPFYVKQGEGYLHEMTSLQVGQQAENFEAVTIDGDSISLDKMEGKVILLDFWATWCGPCIPEIPNLKMLSEKYDEAEFEIISISLDQEKEVLIEMIEEKEMDWKQLYQEKTWQGEIAELYNVNELPRKYLIDAQGKIVAKDIRGDDMIEEVEKQLSK